MPHRLSPFEEGPGRAGSLLLTVLLGVVIPLLTSTPASAHGGAFEIVVEAVNPSDDPGRLAYGVVLTSADGHAMTVATVRFTAVSESGSRVEAAADKTTPGVYIADLSLAPGSWRVNLEIETEDGEEGSVEFTEEVGGSAVEVPVVRIDTAQPERQGAEVSDSSIFSLLEPAAPDAETNLGLLRVEALVRDSVAPLAVEYGVVTDSPNATVTLSATSERSVALGPLPLSPVAPGIFRQVIEYPDAGIWQVTVRVDGPDGGEASFTEALPWPHYTTEVGSPKIKVDSSDPSLEGTLIGIGDSPIFGLPGTSTAPATATTTVLPDGPDDIVVSLPASGSGIAFQVLLRWLHLAGVGLLGVSIAVIGLGRRSQMWAGLAVGGMIAAVATGTALVLWGAPTPFPGIFSWSELGESLYGGLYQWAFLVKMGFVLVAVVATAGLVARNTRVRFAAAASGMVAALAAVVVMVQAHLLAHL